jgi:hypothetical protein
MTGRKNAMLTTEDRRWLTGEKTYDGQHAKQQRYQRRKDIRERVYNSMLDFSILFEELEEDEWREILGEVDDAGRQWRDANDDLQAGVRDGLAFLLRSVDIGALMREDGSTGGTIPERMVTTAVRRAGHRDGMLVESVSVDIEATDVSVPELLKELEDGGTISPSGLYLLMESGAVDTDVVQECLRDQFFDEHTEEV